jgi:hypothetical protein
VAQTNEERWAAWWAGYPGPDKKSAGFSWWSKRPQAYDAAKWLASLDEAEKAKVDEASRAFPGPLSTGTGTAPYK